MSEEGEKRGIEIMCVQIQQFEELFPTYLGSMTALIESCFGNIRIQSLVLGQSCEPVAGFLADAALPQGFQRGSHVLYRRVLLHDPCTQKKFLYASSLIDFQALPRHIADQIQAHPQEPLGRSIKDLRVEKTLLMNGDLLADPFLGQVFGEDASDRYHLRRILFTVEGRSAFLIEEVIPCRCGQACPIFSPAGKT